MLAVALAAGALAASPQPGRAAAAGDAAAGKKVFTAARLSTKCVGIRSS